MRVTRKRASGTARHARPDDYEITGDGYVDLGRTERQVSEGRSGRYVEKWVAVTPAGDRSLPFSSHKAATDWLVAKRQESRSRPAPQAVHSPSPGQEAPDLGLHYDPKLRQLTSVQRRVVAARQTVVETRDGTVIKSGLAADLGSALPGLLCSGCDELLSVGFEVDGAHPEQGGWSWHTAQLQVSPCCRKPVHLATSRGIVPNPKLVLTPAGNSLFYNGRRFVTDLH